MVEPPIDCCGPGPFISTVHVWALNVPPALDQLPNTLMIPEPQFTVPGPNVNPFTVTLPPRLTVAFVFRLRSSLYVPACTLTVPPAPTAPIAPAIVLKQGELPPTQVPEGLE